MMHSPFLFNDNRDRIAPETQKVWRRDVFNGNRTVSFVEERNPRVINEIKKSLALL